MYTSDLMSTFHTSQKYEYKSFWFQYLDGISKSYLEREKEFVRVNILDLLEEVSSRLPNFLPGNVGIHISFAALPRV